MGMGKVAIAKAARAMTTNVSLVGEARRTRRGRNVNHDRRRREAEQLRQQEVAAQPGSKAVWLDDKCSTGRGDQEWQERVCGVGEHAYVPHIAGRVLESLGRTRVGSAGKVSLKLARRLINTKVSNGGQQLKASRRKKVV